jgi:hypothetical protein
MIAMVRRLFGDPAVRWLAAARLIPMVVAPASLYLLVTRQSVSIRGFYLIAINVVMLAQLFETGMGTLVVQFAARARPVDRGVVRGAAQDWFTRAAVAGLILGGTLGTWILMSGAQEMQISFAPAWVVVLGCTTAYVLLVPQVCMHEGGGRAEGVQKLRAVQAMLVAFATLGGLWQGRGIGAAAAAAAAQLAPVAFFVWRRRALLTEPDPAVGRLADQYRTEQMKSARVWLALWAAPQVLTPAAMALRGAAVAGDLGVHVALAFAPALLSVAWLHARYPRLGELVASGAIRTFDDTARHAFRQALAVYAATSAALIALAFAAPYLLPFLAGRVLSPLVLTLLLAGNLMIVAYQAMLAWFRAFGDEKFATQVVYACVAMAGGGVGGAALGGALGAAAGYAGVGVGVAGILAVGFSRLRAQRLAGA